MAVQAGTVKNHGRQYPPHLQRKRITNHTHLRCIENGGASLSSYNAPYTLTTNEVITYEGLGLCPEGGSAEFIANGDNTYGGKIVVGPSVNAQSTTPDSDVLKRVWFVKRLP